MANPYTAGSFLFQWWNWGGAVALGIAFLATFWLFFDAHRTGNDATLWKTLAVVGAVFVIPFVLARLNLSFALSVKDSIPMLAFLNIGGMALVIVSAIGHAASRQPYTCPRCGAPMDPSWAICPSCPPLLVNPPLLVDPPPPPPPPVIVDAFPTVGGTIGGTVSGTSVGAGSDTGGPKTLLLRREPPTFAWLVSLAGVRAGDHFALRSDKTEVGRAGSCDVALTDDTAISEKHFVIRVEDGEFKVQDAASANGTTLNGQALVGKEDLHDWDVIGAGETQLVFMRVKVSAPAVAAGA